MPDKKAGETKTKNEEYSLEVSLQAVPSRLEASGGKVISFTRAMLSMVNTGGVALVDVVPHATFAQERGIVHDATEAISRLKIVKSMQPKETVTWDVYDLLLLAHPGVASKVHLWGYKAVLDWWLDFVAWAEYRTSDVAVSQESARHRWRLRWSPGKSQTDAIDLTMEVEKD